MLTPAAMKKLRTIGFNQADFQVITAILRDAGNGKESQRGNCSVELPTLECPADRTVAELQPRRIRTTVRRIKGRTEASSGVK